MFSEVTIGKKYGWKETVVEVESIDSPSSVTARNVATGECMPISTGDLRPLEQPVTPSPVLKDIREKDWERAKALREALEPTMDQQRLPRGLLGKLAKQFGLCGRQIQEYRRRYRWRPVTSSAAAKRNGRKKGSSGLSARVEAAISHCLNRYYFIREKPDLSEAIDRIAKLCRRIGCRVPSEGAIRRRRDRLDIYDSCKRRLGAQSAGQRLKVRKGHLIVEGPLVRVQIDHGLVDAFVVSDDKWRKPLGRPWLTLAIDVYSRCIVGFYLSLDEPSAVSVAVCISHLLLPKEPWLAALGIDAPWPFYGCPEVIATDNGTDFRGSAMARGCQEHGIDLEFRPVGRPWWGGHIERLIGTVMGWVHFLPGTTFSNPQERDDYDSEGKACMTLSELQNWLVHEICYRYHNKWHRGIGTTPAKAWAAGFSQSTAIH